MPGRTTVLVVTVSSDSNKVGVFLDQTVKGVEKSQHLSWVSMVGGDEGCRGKRQVIQEIGELLNVIIFSNVDRGWIHAVCCISCNRFDRGADEFSITPVDELAVMSVVKLDIKPSLSHA